MSKKDIIALDEDDIIAIITRRLIEEYKLFEGEKIYSKGVKSIPPSNKSALITIVGLYDALDQLFKDEVESLELQKRKRPTDDKIDIFYKRACEWYGYLSSAFHPLEEFQKAQPDEYLARNFRNRQGGHLLFRPIGFVMIHKVAYWLKNASCSLKQACERLSKNPMDLTKPPWVSLLWDKVNKRMLYPSERQKAAEKVLFYQSGGNLSQVKSSIKDLKDELSGMLNRPVNKISLRRYSPKL